MRKDNYGPKRNAVELTRKGIAFLGCQDGPVEQELKRSLRETFLRHPEVQTGYLVRARHGADEISVVLAIVATGDETTLVKKIADVFAYFFSVTQHMDIMFLNAARESKVRAVCLPFYEAESAGS